MPKKRRVPEVLWRLFRHRARTLASTIVSLVSPPPPSSCSCSRTGSQCLSCSGSEAMSFLVRKEDPQEYVKLLNKCFVVASENAPPLSPFQSHSRWPQSQIVQRTIEIMMHEQFNSINVICKAYDKINRASPIVELLSSSAWCLLSQRVGDDVMVYLLKYTSIFLPVSSKKHQQVTGPPISDLCPKQSKKRTLESQHQHTSLDKCGSKKKRALVDNVNPVLEIQKCSNSSSVDDPSTSLDHVGSNVRSSSSPRSFSRLHGNKRSQASSSEVAIPISGTVTNNTEGDLNEKLQESSNHTAAKFGKRSRPFSWQRRRNRRRLNFEETSSFATIHMDKDGVSGRLQHDANSSLNSSEKMPCFSVSQAPKPLVVAKGARINRKFMFYNRECSSSVFPAKHILNSLKPNFSGANFLIGDIFGLNATQEMLCKSACLYRSLVKLLKKLIRKAQRCQRLRLLDKHCAVPTLDATVKSGTNFEGNESEKNVPENSHGSNTSYYVDIEPQFEANKSYCLRSQVESFIWAVIRSVVPRELLGSCHNWRMFRRNIAKFIKLRRFEKFSLKQCMHKLKASSFLFLSTEQFSCCLSNQVLKCTTGESIDMHKGSRILDNATHVLRHKLLESWIFWLFSSLVVPLVQANFYVTEIEHGNQDLYYYRKSVWEKLINKSVTCLKDQGYNDLDAATVRHIIKKRLFGFSKLRFRPKEDGMRMLSNLKASSRMPLRKSSLEDKSCGMHGKGKFCSKKVEFNYFKSVNLVLRDTHAVLKGIQLEEPEKLGASVFDYNDVYRKLCPFLIGLKNRLVTVPGAFVVVSDVLKAFDSIDQDKLLSVLKDVIQKDEYLLKQSHQVVCTDKSLWVHKNLVLMDQNMSTAKVTSSIPFCSLHTVFVNQEWSRHVKKEELFFNLKEHVKYNVLQLDKKFFILGVGIPQGSIVSSLLCSFYYGHLERNLIIPYLEKAGEAAAKDISRRHISNDVSAEESSGDGYILLRFVDDFLLISTSKKLAASFFSRLRRGFHAYNCYMNDDKFSINFDIGDLSGIPSSRVYVGEDGISFIRWSGLLINCFTLEVQADYSKYLNNHLSSTLTVSWQGKPGHHLKTKLCGFMRPKCHPIFFCSNINSADVVRLNIYQAFLVCAMKFHCYVCDLTYICKLRKGFYLKMIQKSVRYMYKLIKKRIRSAYCYSDIQPILQLEEEEVGWLGLYAYIQVLKRKESRHKQLLSSLRCELAHKIHTSEPLPSQLKYAVDASHSSLIWKIKY
ncbi:telomerase reverse transcriptase-like isoform X1 [Quercus robur]|uniref:telomerase reverse transcriptase-like isoform X1 n=1 Tax=Quercus robur TaxID=38942 RepID=UPI0021618754|nr:telomerase reverse transcriptase-like isoform X1 [Quercus robur]